MSDETLQHGGIFVTAGTHIVLPARSLVIALGPDGPEMTINEIHLSREMAPVWLNIAYRHLEDAETAHDEVLRGRDQRDDDLVGRALHEESEAGMQAILAAATALDALYASAKGCISLPPSLTSTWRKNGTARWRQAAEVLRRAFQVKQGEPAKRLRDALHEIYRFRAMVVHPSSTSANVVLHEELNRGVDWRFVSFSARSARTAVWAALSFMKGLVEQDLRAPCAELITLQSDVAKGIEGLLGEWQARFGDVGLNPEGQSA